MNKDPNSILKQSNKVHDESQSKRQRKDHYRRISRSGRRLGSFPTGLITSQRETCRSLGGAQWLANSVLVASADSLVFGDDLGAQQKQRRRNIQA
jgi:hypothetical protein